MKFIVELHYLSYTHNEVEEFDNLLEARTYYNECVDNRDEEDDDCFSLSTINVDEDGEFDYLTEKTIACFTIREYNPGDD